MTIEEQQEIIARARRARAEAMSAILTAAAQGLRKRALGLRHAWAGARARVQLHAMSDRMLKDIGIYRSQIDSLFR